MTVKTRKLSVTGRLPKRFQWFREKAVAFLQAEHPGASSAEIFAPGADSTGYDRVHYRVHTLAGRTLCGCFSETSYPRYDY